MWVTSDVLLDRHALQMWQKNLLETSDWSAIVRARLVSIPRWLDDPVAPAANCQHRQYRQRWCVSSATSVQVVHAVLWQLRKWNWLRHKLREEMTTASPGKHYSRHHKTVTKKYLQKSCGGREMDISLQVQLEEYRGSSIRQNWTETSGLCSTRCNNTSEASQVKLHLTEAVYEAAGLRQKQYWRQLEVRWDLASQRSQGRT